MYDIHIFSERDISVEDNRYEWDDKKNEENIDNHNVSFDEAKDVFSDSYALARADDKHSVAEKRYLIVGKIQDGRVITVCFTHRESRIRLISAQERRKEREAYEKQFKKKKKGE